MAQSTINTVAILSPGDMGNTVGKMLRTHGLRVIAALDERSERTRQLAANAGIEDVGTTDRMVQEADIILSILVPDQATAAAEGVAAALHRTGAAVLYADCNAIAPETAKGIAQIIAKAGSRFVDASIIGGPPRDFESTRIYASGEDAATLANLREYGLNIIDMQSEVGQASAIKMCYGALTKGSTALYTEILTAASALGVADALAAEFHNSQAARYQSMQSALPGMAAKAHRWVGEMEEIAQTFGDVGLTPNIFLGAADIYRHVAGTSVGKVTPEEPKPDFHEMVAVLAAALENKS
ncbi:MAG: NAD(P)-dependent oxidoreductase [Caldilineaceae bacterium]|nr:NAD(P)-dependent oxidoreductase [Caldilineaceae bacterium]